MSALISEKWDAILKDEYQKEYFVELLKKVQSEYETKTVFPPKELIYSAMKTVDYDDVKVVILGQDPYHEKGQANGMAFAVCDGVKYPPSLRNIFTEIASDIGREPVGSTLMGWAKQGVLLLNATLTVREGEAQSHGNFGWQTFTDAIIEACSNREKPMVFILWGNYAINKKRLIKNHHLVLTSAHPSPLSAYRGFFGSKPFSKANAFLESVGQEPIDWLMSDEDASYYENSTTIRRV